MGFEPTVPLSITGFQDQLLKPLGHLSMLPGDPSGARTRDTLIKSQVLYQLSYTPMFNQWAIRDSNPGPTGYEPGALTN